MRAFVVALVLVSCVKSASVAPRAIDRPARGRSAETADSVDRCGYLPRDCNGGPDDDGCPDFLLSVGEKCALDADAEREVAAAAQEMLNEPSLEILRVVGPDPDCARAVVARMASAGVAEGRLKIAVVANRSMITFEVARWKGRTCEAT
jgi:hypothetical protein